MTDNDETTGLRALLNGLAVDAGAYFGKAKRDLAAFASEEENNGLAGFFGQQFGDRDKFWEKLPTEVRDEAARLNDRLVSLMGQLARSVRKTPLASEADQRDVMTGTKAMRAALLLRRFRSWDPEVLHDEGTVLGVTPAGQSDDQPESPDDAQRTFDGWVAKISAVVDLLIASPDSTQGGVPPASDAARYRPGTAFIMMWMDKSQPELVDIADTVKTVFTEFGIKALRADDIEHEGLITERILSEIRTSEFCFADLSGSRPNVYYEIGYAHALSRRVILFRKTGTGLHFDLAGYNCPEYENLRDLKEKLTHRLQALTNKSPSPPTR
jgi:hypothetical protein